ncbi:MAG TPA: hypothetical protein VFL38_01570 [Humibacillus xanthopallidus]|nr:hypothetical protein [Humibacillus xanthopallidus]
MPFTSDSQSRLEGFLERGFVMTMDQSSERHVAPSVHRIVGALMAETAPATAPVDVADETDALADTGDAEHTRDAGNPQSLEDREDAASAASFEALMAADLAWFEGGQRVKSMADDHQLEALARLHATALAELDARHAQSWIERTPLSAREAVVTEVAAATGLSQADLSIRLELATAPAARSSYLREQIRTGTTTIHRACELVRQTRHLDDDAFDHVARTTLAPTRDGAGLTGTLFRQRLRRALLTADADHAERRRAARAHNRAWAEIHDDGTGRLTVVNDADKIVAAYDRADTAARAARAAGDPRTLDQLRADYLTGAAITGWPHSDSTTDTTTDAGNDATTDAGNDATTDAGNGAESGSPTDSDEGAANTSDSNPAGSNDVPGSTSTTFSATPTGAAQSSSGGGDAHGTTRASGAAATEAAPTGITRSGAVRAGGGFAAMSPSPAGKAIIVIPFETALGLDDQPCELTAHGHLSAAQAREIITAPGSIWHTLLADPTTGRAIAITPGYRPTREMVEHVRAVDGTCRGPGCTVPARNCDLDHDTPWPDGPTHPDNLTAKHRQHHRLKTAGWWTATREDDALTWHTAAVRTYTTHPKDWLEGRHPHETPVGAPAPPTPSTTAALPTAAQTPDAAPDTRPTGTASIRPTPDPPPF